MVKGVLLEEIRIFPAELPGDQVTPAALELQEMKLLSPQHYLTHYLAKIKQVSREAVGDKMLVAIMCAVAATAAEDVFKVPSTHLDSRQVLGGRGSAVCVGHRVQAVKRKELDH